MSTIRYFLPEDGDSEDTPNVFLAPKPNRPGYPPLLGQIRNSFPLPGSYHFRFKTAIVPGTDKDKNAVAVWMDCIDDSAPVPMWQSSIIAKVTRIAPSDGINNSGENFSRADSIISTDGSSSRSIPKSKSTTHSLQHSSDSLLGTFDEEVAPTPSPAPVAPSPPAHSAPSSTGNLLDVDRNSPAPPASGGSLLDMDHLETHDTAYHSTEASTHHDELLNMTAPMPVQSRPTPAPLPRAQVPVQYPVGQPQPLPQQPSMQGQYPQYPQQGQQGMAGQQRMGQTQGPFNQSARNPPMNANGSVNKNAFDKFSGGTLDPLGNLKWS